jgi:hypothetical protein
MARAWQVKRELLRHRKLHTKAVFGITDDKKHDSCVRPHLRTT